MPLQAAEAAMDRAVTQLEKLGARARKALPDAILAVAELDEEEPLPDDADG